MKHPQLLILFFFLLQFSLAQQRQDFRTNQKDTFYGKVVDDPYRSLEDTGNAKVKAWMRSEAEKTKQFFASIPGRKKLYDQINTAYINSKLEDVSDIQYWNNKFYVSKRYPGQDNFRLYEIDKTGTEKLFLDPLKLIRKSAVKM